MKVLFVGLGSIGKRHLDDLIDILSERGEEFIADRVSHSDTPLPDKLAAVIRNTYHSFSEVTDRYDCTFICNPTSLHGEAIKALIGCSDNMYIEKPMFESLDPEYEAIPWGNGIYHVACPLRFHPVIRRMYDLSKENRIVSFRALCSSYLPGWRPGSDYKQSYSARKDLGGGVRLDLIHEIDYIHWMFGSPDEALCRYGTYGGLGIETEDTADYILKWQGMTGTVHLDYLGDPTRRSLEFITDKGELIFGDIVAGTVMYSDTIEILKPTEDIRRTEMRYFVRLLAGEESPMNDQHDGWDSLKISLE